jgi:hypothetical protein
MKKIFAYLILTGLVLVSFAPGIAGYADRTPVQEYCMVGQSPDGSPIYDMRVTSCLVGGLSSCMTEFCCPTP